MAVTVAQALDWTVMAAVALLVSLVAVIVTGPPALDPVTSPAEDTVAIPLFELPQLTTRPLSGFPLTSFGVAASWSVVPTGTRPVPGDTATNATGTGVTVIWVDPVTPSDVAESWTGPPALRAATRLLAPKPATEAIVELP